MRYQRTILAPARWRLPPWLTSATRRVDTWRTELRRWRTTTVPPPPDIVVTEASDRQLPLDLRNERDCDLLRRYVRRGLDAVVEQPGGPTAVLVAESTRAGEELFADGWVGAGRARRTLRALLTVRDGGGERQHGHERHDSVHAEHATAARAGLRPPRRGPA